MGCARAASRPRVRKVKSIQEPAFPSAENKSPPLFEVVVPKVLVCADHIVWDAIAVEISHCCKRRAEAGE